MANDDPDPVMDLDVYGEQAGIERKERKKEKMK
jgi:hypothetical protein